MSKIDINRTSKVNIETQNSNTFNLVMNVQNEDNTSYDFENDLFILTIFDDDKTPIKILSHHIDSIGVLYGIDEPFFLNNKNNATPNTSSLRFARALSNLYNCDINIFTFNNNFREFPYALSVSSLLGAALKIVTVNTAEGIINISVPAFVMHMPAGTYNYNIKVVSDLVRKYDFNNQEIDAYFKNSETWMDGKFIIN